MDLATVIGLVLCIVIMIFGMVFDKTTMSLNFGVLPGFVDVSSILITFGGAFMSTLVGHTVQQFVGGLKSIGLAIKGANYNEGEIIRSIIDLSNIARKEGLLALEEAANNLEDPFLKKGILLIVDGTDPELVRGIMETELGCIEERHMLNIGFWEKLGAMGPAWGMIGTLIGLINMLKKMSDIESLGPNMAVALVTTFYGSVLANWICTPISSKLQLQNSMEVRVKSIIIEGLLSIQAGENPRVIEEKLKSFLAPVKRNEMSPGDAERGGE